MSSLGKDEQKSAQSLAKTLNAGSEEYGHFLNLGGEKRERVLGAAYDEFLEKGYGEASTNVITQKAGISKGLLFHYFGSKEGLYKFLMEESARRIATEALAAIPAGNGDVFAIIKSVIQIKITVCLRHPKETDFLIAAWSANLPESLLRQRENMAGMSSGYFDVVFGLIDGGMIRDGTDKTIAAEIIAWVCEKYTDKVLSSGAVDTMAESWNRIAENMDKYFDALRHGLYK
jgi:AcrR family transcriptional regulator